MKYLLTLILISSLFISPVSALSTGKISEQTLSISVPVFSFTISGDIIQNGKNSLVRAIMVDGQNREFLIAEVYGSAENNNQIALKNTCTETCYLPGVIPVKIRLEEINGKLTISDYKYTDSVLKTGIPQNQIAQKAKEKKHEIDLNNIKKINGKNMISGKKWTAGETSVSLLTYAEKKNIFRLKKQGKSILNLQGFEYYQSGTFETGVYQPLNSVTSSLFPASYDYRTLHGENWITPIRDQGRGDNAWVFSTVGAFESLINLYYNRHLNIDLSEQMYADCANTFDLPLGMNPYAYAQCGDLNFCFPGSDYCVFNAHGISDEACDPYAGRDLSSAICSTVKPKITICTDWQNRVWKPAGFMDYKSGSDFGTSNCPYQQLNLLEDDFKKALITKGPLNSGVQSLDYNMTLIGYDRDPADGSTVWIFKGSLGTSWGEGGYARIKTTAEDIGYLSAPLTPLTPPPGSSYSISCTDNDNDSYCNWGITETKPSSCPSVCLADKDCNDSNSSLGPYDINYHCISILSPTPTGIYAREDINRDGKINFLDLNAYLLNYSKNFFDHEIIADGKTNLLDIIAVLLIME